jgi:hypothetical protein
MIANMSYFSTFIRDMVLIGFFILFANNIEIRDLKGCPRSSVTGACINRLIPYFEFEIPTDIANFIASTLLITLVFTSENAQKLLRLPQFLFLGKISYMFYLLHMLFIYIYSKKQE